MKHIDRMKEILRIHDHRGRSTGFTGMEDRLSVEVLVSDLARILQEYDSLLAIAEDQAKFFPDHRLGAEARVYLRHIKNT